ncbi:hypothetical protein ACFWF7_36270 [Nocardia sp. NPDC060256]|uniref:hypothetical protein n=1 Tax=unclassified Nocardia TaxID=2637762 RepID=UPI00365B953D
MQEHAAGQITDEAFADLYDAAARDTVAQLESLGSRSQTATPPQRSVCELTAQSARIGIGAK